MSQLLYINASHPLVFQRFNVPIFMQYNVSFNNFDLGFGGLGTWQPVDGASAIEMICVDVCTDAGLSYSV